MGFYELSPEQRKALVKSIDGDVLHALQTKRLTRLLELSGDTDTYIRKNTYQTIGRRYKSVMILRQDILTILETMLSHENELVRQTAVYALGEIGKIDAPPVFEMLEVAIHDKHHKVINAVIGALKQMGEKNPQPTLAFAAKFIRHNNPDIRREMIHGIELRGRTHPEDVLPLLQSAEHDDNKKVIAMIIHVLGQISYKKGCLDKVLNHLKTWNNKSLVKAALDEILEVHKRYSKFSTLTYGDSEKQIRGMLSEF
ncbi:HEAT repeat domain-containing protein [candidate division KSB1 bacterium]|nr:HEAT repeat domain-containing protein [candidate division KSB1 bacterium]